MFGDTWSKMDKILEQTLKKMDPGLLAAACQKQGSRGSECQVLTKKAKKVDEENAPINQYKGWKVPAQNYAIPQMSLKDVYPETFFKEYIGKRRPIVIQGTPPELQKLANWTNAYLATKSGEEKVMVEKRSTIKDAYGQGNEIPMKFSKFLELISKGDTMHYLTTQDVHANEDGRPDLMAPFMKTLNDDFPLRPQIMGNLVPQNINLWFGNNQDGSSSGLHVSS